MILDEVMRYCEKVVYKNRKIERLGALEVYLSIGMFYCIYDLDP